MFYSLLFSIQVVDDHEHSTEKLIIFNNTSFKKNKS